VLANTAAQIPGPDLWNSRIQSARQTAWMASLRQRRALVHKSFSRHQSGKSGARLGDGPDHAAKRLFGSLRGGARHGSARSHTKHWKQGPGHRRAARSVDTARMGALVANSIEGAKFITLEASHISNIEDEANFTKAAVAFLTAPETVAVMPRPRRKAPAKKAPAKKAAARNLCAPRHLRANKYPRRKHR